MDHDIKNSLEAISNLIYLIRHSLHDPAKTLSYVELAEERLKAIAQHTPEEVDRRWTNGPSRLIYHVGMA
jgi:two-component sensor histidine kinase